MRPQAVSVGEIVAVEGGGHIVKATGRKDRHSKVCTARGLRDRRVRLSALTAIQFYDVQDRLGFDRPSKAVDWLMKNAKPSIDELTRSSSSPTVPVPLPEPAAPSTGRSRSRDKAKQPELEPEPQSQSQAQTAAGGGGGGGGEPTSSSSGSERFLPQQQQQHQFSSQEESQALVHSHHVHLAMQNHAAAAAVAGGFISPSCDAAQTELQPQSVYQALLLQNLAAGGMFQEASGPSRFRTPRGSFPPSSQFARSAVVPQFPPAETVPPWMPATPQQQQQQFGFGFGFGVGVGADFRKETLQSSSVPAFLAGSNPHHMHPHLPQQQQFVQNHQFMVSPQVPSAVAASFSSGGGGGFSGFRIPVRIQGIDEQDGGGGTAESKPPSAASSSSHFG